MLFMKPLLLAFFLICFIGSNAQKEIRLEEIKEYIGDSVKVQGKISGMIGNSKSNSQKPTVIYVGGNYPKQMLTIFISPEVRSTLHVNPLLSDVGNMVWVSGKVKKYKGKTLIVIKDPRQLDIIQDMQGDIE
jgi:RecJ-like exonuclease